MRRTSHSSFCMLAVICLTAIIFIGSCTDKEETFETAPFSSNATLVDTSLWLPEIDLEFSPPAGWTMLDSANLDNFRKMLGGTDLAREFYPVFPLMVFSDSVTGSIFYIAQIEEAEAGMPQIAQHFTDFIEPRTTSAAVTKANYLINEMKIYYYLVHSSEMVNYKLIGEGSPEKRFLIEFVVGGFAFAQMEPTISASLATLKPRSVPENIGEGGGE